MPLALVTGSGIRVGRAVALALGEAGYDLIVHVHRSVEEGEAVAGLARAMGRSARVVSADLSTLEGPGVLAQAVKGPLDLLVLSAAAYEHVGFADVDRDRFEHMFNVNVRSPFFLTQALLPRLRDAKGASVVAITDMALTHAYTSTHFFSHYLASKAALAQLVRAWALELGPAIRVNAVAPGPVAMASETTEDQRRDILGRTPLGREGRPEDIAQAVLYLARAAYVTGHTVVVDGGLSVS